MPIPMEHVTELGLGILLAIVLADGVVIAFVVARRHRRNRYFRRIDALREHYAPLIAGVLAQRVAYTDGLAALRGVTGIDRESILGQLCTESNPKPIEVPILRQLSEDLGLVRTWQRNLAGDFDPLSLREALSRQEGIVQRLGRLQFLLRARAAANLGFIQHQPSWPLLVKALDDPHAEVQSAALRALGNIQEPESFPYLVERLHAVVLGPAVGLSLRSVKAVLAGFPLCQAAGLLGSLKHSHPRIRFLATDIIREIVEQEAAREPDSAPKPKAFPSELGNLFLTRLYIDENPDVRARAAPVIACLDDPRTVPALLTLLDDPQWFIRLHTVRALAKPKYLPQAARIARRLTDSHWRVREAAARALLVFGHAGIDQLSEHFLATQDQYSREQIADEMQRAGLIPPLLAQYGNHAGASGTLVIEQLLEMGKSSALVAALRSGSDGHLQKKFVQRFGRRADPEIQAWVKHLAAHEADPELRALAQATMRTPAA